ncbi:unnamed protein product, partial [Protopolystoma xenopodis]
MEAKNALKLAGLDDADKYFDANGDEVVVVEPTDPDEDRLMAEKQLLAQHYAVTTSPSSIRECVRVNNAPETGAGTPSPGKPSQTTSDCPNYFSLSDPDVFQRLLAALSAKPEPRCNVKPSIACAPLPPVSPPNIFGQTASADIRSSRSASTESAQSSPVWPQRSSSTNSHNGIVTSDDTSTSAGLAGSSDHRRIRPGDMKALIDCVSTVQSKAESANPKKSSESVSPHPYVPAPLPSDPLLAAVVINCATASMVCQLATAVCNIFLTTGTLSSDMTEKTLPLLVCLQRVISSLNPPNLEALIHSVKMAPSLTDQDRRQLAEVQTIATESIRANLFALDDSNMTALTPCPTSDDSSVINCKSSGDTGSAGSTASRSVGCREHWSTRRYLCPYSGCTDVFVGRLNLIEHIRRHTLGQIKPSPGQTSRPRADVISPGPPRQMHPRPEAVPASAGLRASPDRCLHHENPAVLEEDSSEAVETVKLEEKCQLVPSSAEDVDVDVDVKVNVSTNKAQEEAQADSEAGRLAPACGLKIFVCDRFGCSRRFFSTPDLEHHKLIHLVPQSGDPVRKHLCPYPGCGKSYSKLNKLREHVRSHTGERPYVCDHPGCGSTFIRVYALKRHKQLHDCSRRNVLSRMLTKRRSSAATATVSKAPPLKVLSTDNAATPTEVQCPVTIPPALTTRSGIGSDASSSGDGLADNGSGCSTSNSSIVIRNNN